MPKIVVGTGWWGTNERVRGLKGLTRHPSFFEIWHYFVRRYIDPDLIFVVNACGPAEPDFAAHPDVQVVNLDRNYGTPSDLRSGRIETKHCGWSRTVFLSTACAIACDADYYLYIEQDCLVFGQDFLSTAIGSSKGTVLMGVPPKAGNDWRGSGELVPLAEMPQNSLLIAKNGGLQALFNAVIDGDFSDGEHPVENRMRRNLEGKGLDYLAIPYGRDRPIDLGQKAFYAQDWTPQELRDFLDHERAAGGTPPPHPIPES